MSRYVIFAETNGGECETWYYFIKKEGNEKTLKHLSDQLEEIDMYIIDDFSSFDLDLEHSVSAETAKEMTKVELNHYMFHRKFDGNLKPINLKRKKKASNYEWIISTHQVLSYGQIENYISDEDIDTEDLMTDDEDDEDNASNFSEDSSDEEIVPPPLDSDNNSDSDEDDKPIKKSENVSSLSSERNERTVLGRPTFVSDSVNNIPRNRRKKKKKHRN
jgi:hypothetical protein